MSSLEWKVHTSSLLRETLANPNMGALHQPYRIMANLLEQVAKRASEINDPQLNALMMRLTLYEVADPYSEEFDAVVVAEIIERGRQATPK